MDDRVLEDVARDVWSEEFSRSLAQLKRGAEELLKDQRSKWQSAESVLLRQIVELRETIAREESRGEALREELASRRTRLDEESLLLNNVLEQVRHRQEEAMQSQVRLEAERKQFLDEFARKGGELELARREVALAQEEVARRREALAVETAKLEQRSAEIAAQHVAVAVQGDEQKAALQELEVERKRLAELKHELDETKAALDRERDLLQIRQRETAEQRKRLAREFRLQRMQLLAEVHQGNAAASPAPERAEEASQLRLLSEEIAVRAKQQESLEQQLLELREQLSTASALETQLRTQLAQAQSEAGGAAIDHEALAELRRQFEQLQVALHNANSERTTLQTTLLTEREQHAQAETRFKRDLEGLELEVKQLREQQQKGVMAAEKELAEAQMGLTQAKVEIDRHKEQLAALRAQLEEKGDELLILKNEAAKESASEATLAALQVERDALLAKIESLQNAPSHNAEHELEMDNLRRRMEMTLSDLRHSNAQIADLKRQLAQRPAAGAAAPAEAANDWEAQKRKLLAQLEAADADTPQEKAEKLRIEEVIDKTDIAIADKEAEIAELKALLEMRPAGDSAAGETAFGAAAISQLLDSDELVKQQREALERMTQELQEKLRQAEIDTSLERAKLARERAELQEQLQKMEEERTRWQEQGSRPDDKSKTPGKRNWLDHLGLNKGQQGG